MTDKQGLSTGQANTKNKKSQTAIKLQKKEKRNGGYHVRKNSILLLGRLAYNERIMDYFYSAYQLACSSYCSLYFSLGAHMKNLFDCKELLELVIISFILMTLMCD